MALKPATLAIASTPASSFSLDLVDKDVVGYVDRTSGSFRSSPRLTTRFSDASQQRPTVRAQISGSIPIMGVTAPGATGVIRTNRFSISIELGDGAVAAEMVQLRTLVQQIVANQPALIDHLFNGQRLV